jgi:hypothetical protein
MGSHSADERTTTEAAAAEVGLAPAATGAVLTPAAVAGMTAPRIRAARGLVAAVGIAGSLALTGCGLLPETGTGTDEPCGSDQAGCVQVDSSEEPTDGAPSGEAADPEAQPSTEAAGGSDADGTGTNGSGSDGSGDDGAEMDDEDWIKTESLAGDSSVELDEDGNGKFPTAALEADIEDLFVNKFGLPVTSVDCAHDATMIAGSGSTICDIETDERTYYGTVRINQDEGELFRYELQFPGLPKDELDLD